MDALVYEQFLRFKWATIATLCVDCNISRKEAQEACDNLEWLGVIEKISIKRVKETVYRRIDK